MGGDAEWWAYVLIPIISGVVGWGTNWLALQMTFYPIEFLPVKIWQPKDQPVGCIGWQGIIPAKAATMAGDFCDMMTSKLFSVEEIFSRIDPARMADILEPGLQPSISRIVSELAKVHAPGVWAGLPVEVHDELFEAVKDYTRDFTIGFMETFRANILTVFDIRHMVVEEAVKHKEYLVDMFQTVGDKEFVFIERSGFYFGFLFGLPQALVFYFYDSWWVLPAAGFIVGFATNYLALFLIFHPIEPLETCCCTLQGAFLKRQEHVSVVFAEMCERLFLQPQTMWNEVFAGPKHKEFEQMLIRHVKEHCDHTLGQLTFPVGVLLGAEKYDEIKQHCAELLIEELPKCTPLTNDYMRECLNLTAEMGQKMAALPPTEFEGVLHPVFEADELKLILVGAALGTAAGFVQTAIF